LEQGQVWITVFQFGFQVLIFGFPVNSFGFHYCWKLRPASPSDRPSDWAMPRNQAAEARASHPIQPADSTHAGAPIVAATLHADPHPHGAAIPQAPAMSGIVEQQVGAMIRGQAPLVCEPSLLICGSDRLPRGRLSILVFAQPNQDP
jgi:hypothetical protein